MTKRTTRRSKSTTTQKASRAKAAKPRSGVKRRAPAKASAKPARRGRSAAAKASAKPSRRGRSAATTASTRAKPALRGRTAAARAQTRTVVAPKLAPKRRGTARQGSGEMGSGEEPTPALQALDPDESRFGPSEASFHLEDSSEGADGLREELGESYVENATGVDDAAMLHREVTTVGELGGPFVITSASTEFADGIDASNPVDAERAPVPTV